MFFVVFKGLNYGIDFKGGSLIEIRVENKDIKTSEVVFGTKVTIREEGNDQDETYYILGPIEFELDLFPLVVTLHSPFGQAIIGKKVNETFTLDIRGEETKFTIKNIEKVPDK